jgi:thymidylate synthase (FAD)
VKKLILCVIIIIVVKVGIFMENGAQAAAQEQQCFDPLGDGISLLELIRVSGSDVDVVNAARVSYGKYVTSVTARDAKLIQFLMDHQHTSPFEHNQLSFRVKAPLFVARQWMRHRMNSYNEISYRYVKAPFEFYKPPFWRYQDTQNKQVSYGSFSDQDLDQMYGSAIDHAVQVYETMLARGVCRELARGVLPLCTYTQFIFTTNLHSLMHFFKLRLNPGAQHEIRQYAKCMLDCAKKYFPITLSAWYRANSDTLVGLDIFTKEFAQSAE